MTLRRGASIALWYLVATPSAAALVLHDLTWQWSRGSPIASEWTELILEFGVGTLVVGTMWLVLREANLSGRYAPLMFAAGVISLAVGGLVAVLVGLAAALEESPALSGRPAALVRVGAVGGTVSLMFFGFLCTPLMHRALTGRESMDSRG